MQLLDCCVLLHIYTSAAGVNRATLKSYRHQCVHGDHSQLKAWYVAIILKRRDENVEEPEGEHEDGGWQFVLRCATELTPEDLVPPQHDETNTHEGATAEDCYREGKTARIHLK